jgi:hypothetical protein
VANQFLTGVRLRGNTIVEDERELWQASRLSVTTRFR